MKNDSRNTSTKQRMSATSGGLAHPWGEFGMETLYSRLKLWGFGYLIGIKERSEEVKSFMINEYLFKWALYIYCYLKGDAASSGFLMASLRYLGRLCESVFYPSP